MESLNLASKLYKTDFFRMKCSTQDWRQITRCPSKFWLLFQCSKKFYFKKPKIGISNSKKNRQKSEVFVCFIDERHLDNFYISLKLFVYFFSCLFTLSAVVYFSVSCLFTFLAAVYFFSSQLADCRLFVYFFSWLFTIFDSCLFTIWIFPPKLSYFSFVLNFLGHPVLQEV